VPTLVVRSAEPFIQWVKGLRPLKVVVGLDLNLVSDDAWTWAQDLRRLGPVEVIGVHVYWPPDEFHRLGLEGVRSVIDADPEVDRVLRREFEARFQNLLGNRSEFRFEASIGRVSDHLVSVAAKLEADLLVVGSHQRNAISRLWEGSVSHGALQFIRGSVACIPLATHRPMQPRPQVRSVLAATDFSEVGNAALQHAYAHVGRGGTVYLVHVLEPAKDRPALEPRDIFTVSDGLGADKQSSTEGLRRLASSIGASRDCSTEVIILESRDAADAIAQAANRLGVDVICMGTRGRSAVQKAVLGSVAQSVLSKTDRPVLLVRGAKV
jgi:nucleotide-binding universal stress UspA family protein